MQEVVGLHLGPAGVDYGCSCGGCKRGYYPSTNPCSEIRRGDDTSVRRRRI